jgi:uncharacterized protein (DUF1697 family)
VTPAGKYVALLRGINVGGKRPIPMKELAAIFVDAGCRDVRTYIQSGNVVYSASAAVAKRVASTVAGAISARFGFDVPVVTRTARELGAVVANNPFLKRGEDSRALHVGFLMDRPARARIAALDPDRSSPDEFAVHGAEVYLFFPNGVARTKLTAQYFDSTLGTTITVRNWNTVQKLLDMVR